MQNSSSSKQMMTIFKQIKTKTGENNLPPLECNKQARQKTIEQLERFQKEYLSSYNDKRIKNKDQNKNFTLIQQSIIKVSNGDFQQIYKNWKKYFQKEKSQKIFQERELLNIVFQLLKWGCRYVLGYCTVSQCLYNKTNKDQNTNIYKGKIKEIKQYVLGKNNGNIQLNSEHQDIGLHQILDFIKQKKASNNVPSSNTKDEIVSKVRSLIVNIKQKNNQNKQNLIELKRQLEHYKKLNLDWLNQQKSIFEYHLKKEDSNQLQLFLAQKSIRQIKENNLQKRRKIKQKILNLKTDLIQVKSCLDNNKTIKEYKIKMKSNFQSAKQNLTKQMKKALTKLSQTNFLSNLFSTSKQPQQAQIKQFDFQQRFLSSSILLGFKPFSHIRQHPVLIKQGAFLIESLQKFRSKKITRTHLLYQHNPRLALNFHAYIDNIPSYVVLLKLPNCNIIAAYSIPALGKSAPSPEAPLNESPVSVQPQSPQGIILCLQTGKSLTQQPQLKSSRPTTYDEYYIMFGNQELKIYVNNNKVQVFFGSVFGFYRPKIQQIDFCGLQGGEEVNFLALQVHKVVFEGEEEYVKGKEIEMKQK